MLIASKIAGIKSISDKEYPEPVPFGRQDPLGEGFVQEDMEDYQTVEDFDTSMSDLFGLPSQVNFILYVLRLSILSE